MSERITNCFQELKRRNKTALIPFITAGDPSLEVSRELALGLAARGADIIELGIPFTDPVADGPVIQESTARALKNGVTPSKVLQLAQSIREKTAVPIVILTYYNPVLRMGLKKFVKNCLSAGIDGLVIPDLPYEENQPLKDIAGKNLDIISFLSPLSSVERIKKITREPSGFIYCVAVAGVTGTRRELSSEAKEMLENIKKYTDLPLALGFGISTPEQGSEAAIYADAVIVGSALVNKISSIKNKEDIAQFLDYFTSFRELIK